MREDTTENVAYGVGQNEVEVKDNDAYTTTDTGGGASMEEDGEDYDYVTRNGPNEYPEMSLCPTRKFLWDRNVESVMYYSVMYYKLPGVLEGSLHKRQRIHTRW